MSGFALGDEKLTTKLLVDAAKQVNPKLQVSAKAKARLKKFRSIVDESTKSDNTFYGINTGFGLMADVRIGPDKLRELQLNIVRSHACGVGDPVPATISRGVLVLRAHTFLIGHSGIRSETLEHILKMIEQDILPVIPSKGSVGASGDLAPLSHAALGMIGEGEVQCGKEFLPAAEAFKKRGLKPLALSSKEGLSLINGTHFMTVIAAFATEEAKNLAFAADVIAAMSLNAIRGTVTAFRKEIHDIRPQPGQLTVASNLVELFEEPGEIMTSHENCGKVQDPYSFRCAPQVHGASRDAIAYVENVVNTELNSVTDNPLVFENGEILSGGNFHGQPVAMAADFLGIAVAELGSISEQRIQKMINPHMSGLPAFIINEGGLNSGYMIPQVVAASLVSENKIYSHPAVVDSIPTSADKEDHVSMGPIAARKARMINENVASILAIELLAACQGVDLLAPLKLNKVLDRLYKEVRKMSPYMEKDRSLQHDIKVVSDWLLDGGLRRLIDSTGMKLN
jgi:histidine ammonia-lyase